MTGFARADGEYADWQWSWETKSVNNKALDVRVRMPSGHDRLELPSRQAASKRFKRGSVNMVLNLARASAGEDKNKYEVNENLLSQLLAAAKEHSNTDVQNIETLLTIRGVVDKVDEAESETDQAQRHASILKCLDEALDALLLNRQLEGQKLHSILSAQLDEIQDCVRNAASAESLRPELRKQRLQIQLREVLEAEPPVTEDRLAQELAILLIKGDITTPEPVITRTHAMHEASDILGIGPRSVHEVPRAMEIIAREGRGVVCLFREPRKTLYAREDDGPRTIKQTGLGAQILSKLGLHELVLLTDSPQTKYVGLDAYGLSIIGTRPIMSES